jgi:hypothetical protein
MFADLHLHSHFSDGTWRPAELVAQARRHELVSLALADHDTVEGCAPMAAACAAAGLDFLPATELTAEQGGEEIHLLAYGIDAGEPALLVALSTFQRVRQERVREMVGRLNRLRVPLAAEAVFALADCRAPGRPHVARALVNAGCCASLDEAFERFLKKDRPAWVPKFKLAGPAAIALIHRAGGLAVLAHPGLTCCDGAIPALVAAGLDGLECFHPKHSGTAAARYVALAARQQLLVTGGSDCHGPNHGGPLIGTVKLPLPYVEQLKARLAERKPGIASPAPARHIAG